MSKQYTFIHTCGHTGLGPIIRTHEPLSPEDTSTSLITNICLPISFACPFCRSRALNLPIEDGSGLLTMMCSPLNDAFTNDWAILGICRPEDISKADWALAHQFDGGFRHMAWIPKPCGEVEVFREIWRAGEVFRMRDGGEGSATEIKTKWKQMVGEPPTTRLAGMLSTLNSALRWQQERGRRGNGVQ